jgi:hypothetical protein
MNLETARQHLHACSDRMDALYNKPVFDEWVIVKYENGKADVLHYDGPRPAAFLEKMHGDTAPLLVATDGRKYEVGDFEFVSNAAGSRYDACVRLGNRLFLLCNNTYGTMEQIRADPRWLKAQAPFLDMTEKFRADPLA